MAFWLNILFRVKPPAAKAAVLKNFLLVCDIDLFNVNALNQYPTNSNLSEGAYHIE